jgi:hypothetical protein
MSDNQDDDAGRKSGRRKDGKPYKAGNTRDDGSYREGKNRPPVKHQFRKDDGRKRGARPKGARNADTEFERELNRKVVIKEDGKVRKVTKSQAVDLRLIDNATRKGDNRAIEMVDTRRRRIAESAQLNGAYHSLRDIEILEAWIKERSAELNLDPALLGDPEPPPTDDEGKPDD